MTSHQITGKETLVRDQQVMLDYDLAAIYGYTTSAFNQQVKNNLAKFEGEDFMFRLTREELLQLSISNNLTSIQIAGRKGGRTKPPLDGEPSHYSERTHDRYLIIDHATKYQKIYHAGGSAKDAGYKVTSIVEMINDDVTSRFVEEMLGRLATNPLLRLK